MKGITLQEVNQALKEISNQDRGNWMLRHRLYPTYHIVLSESLADARIVALPHWIRLSFAYGGRTHELPL